MLTKCTNCQKNLQVADSSSGKKVQCPLCKQVFTAAPLTPVAGAVAPVKPPAMRDTRQITAHPVDTRQILPPPVDTRKVSAPPKQEMAEPKTMPDAAVQDPAQVLTLIQTYRRELEKTIVERNQAMEMVDNFFNMFMERAEKPELSGEEQQESRHIAQKLFELQKKFPLLAGFNDVLNRCEKVIHNFCKR